MGSIGGEALRPRTGSGGRTGFGLWNWFPADPGGGGWGMSDAAGPPLCSLLETSCHFGENTASS